MSVFHRSLALAGTVAATAALAFGGSVASASAAPASTAATGVEVLHISGGFTVVDDDGSSRPKAKSTFTRTIALSAADPTETLIIPSACAGDEVRAELRLEFIRLSDGRVYVQDAAGGLGLHMYEGTSCSTNDLDGQMNVDDIVSQRGTTDTRSLAVGNQDEGGFDNASVSFSVAHTVQ